MRFVPHTGSPHWGVITVQVKRRFVQVLHSGPLVLSMLAWAKKSLWDVHAHAKVWAALLLLPEYSQLLLACCGCFLSYAIHFCLAGVRWRGFTQRCGRRAILHDLLRGWNSFVDIASSFGFGDLQGSFSVMQVQYAVNLDEVCKVLSTWIWNTAWLCVAGACRRNTSDVSSSSLVAGAIFSDLACQNFIWRN